MPIKRSPQQEALAKLTPDEIQQFYELGQITAQDKHYMLREKAKMHLEDLSLENDWISAIWKRTIEHVQEGWDNIVEGGREGILTESATTNLYNEALIAWGQIQILLAPMSALGDVAGIKVENYALNMGASPGLAWFIGRVADIGSGFAIPSNLFAKGVKQVAEKVGIKGVELAAAKTGRKTAGLTGKELYREEAKGLISAAEGLTIDGVSDAHNLIAKAAEQAGSTEVANVIKQAATAAGATTAKVASTTTLGVETFAKDAAAIAGATTRETARAELPKLMKKFGISWNDLKQVKQLFGGSKSMSAQEFYGYLKALEPRAAELTRLAKAAIAEGATRAEQTAFAKYATQLFTGSSDRVTYSKEFLNMLVHWDPANVAKGDLSAAMRTFAADMASLTQREATSFIIDNQRGFVKYGELGRVGLESFRNMLLPLSAIPAVIGNSVGAANTVLERVGAGEFKSAWYVMKGMTMATADALRAVKLAYQTNAVHRTITGTKGMLINIPTTNMVAVDAYFKTVVMRGELYAHALREGELRGVKNLGLWVKNALVNPATVLGDEALARAQAIADRATFQNDLGEFARRFGQAFQGGNSGPGTLYFTFWKNPINLVKYAWNRTPALQLMSKQLYTDILAGGELATQAVGRITMATLQGMLVFELAKEGVVTGSGPTDPELQKAWRATHEPYAVKTPSGWVSYRAYTPIATQVGLIADFVQIHDQLNDMQAGQGAMAITYSLMQNVANQTQWRQLSEIVDVANGVARGERLTTRDKLALIQPGMTIAQGGPLVARAARVVDPVTRDARNLVDSWAAKIPGYSRTVPPLRDGYGDVAIPPETPGSPWFGFFYPLVPRMKPLTTDRVKLEGDRLHAKLPAFEDSMTRAAPRDDFDINEPQPGDSIPVALTPEQRDRWQQIHRNIVRGTKDDKFAEENPGIERGLLDTEFYKNAPLGMKRKLFESFMSDAKSAAKDALMLEDKELYKKVLMGEASRVMKMVPSENIPDIQAGVQEGISLFDDISEEQRDNLLKWGYLEPDQPVTREGRTLYEPRTVKPMPKASDFGPGGSFYQERKPGLDIQLKVGE